MTEWHLLSDRAGSRDVEAPRWCRVTSSSSYSHHAAALVDRLKQKRSAAGLDVWIDWEDIPFSANGRDEISRAVDGASAFVRVLRRLSPTPPRNSMWPFLRPRHAYIHVRQVNVQVERTAEALDQCQRTGADPRPRQSGFVDRVRSFIAR